MIRLWIAGLVARARHSLDAVKLTGCNVMK